MYTWSILEIIIAYQLLYGFLGFHLWQSPTTSSQIQYSTVYSTIHTLWIVQRLKSKKKKKQLLTSQEPLEQDAGFVFN